MARRVSGSFLGVGKCRPLQRRGQVAGPLVGAEHQDALRRRRRETGAERERRAKIIHAEGELQAFARKVAWHAGVGTLALIGIVSLWTPLLQPEYMERWFGWPALLYVAPVPLLVVAAATSLFLGLRRGHDARPFLSANALFILCYIGLVISFYPFIVPPSISIWQAAGPDSSLKFLLVGAVVLIPIIVVYTAHAYWVFRGKMDPEAGYH